jgi:hypothetical protein
VGESGSSAELSSDSIVAMGFLSVARMNSGTFSSLH